MAARIDSESSGSISVAGDIDNSNAVALLEQGYELLAGGSKAESVVFDFSAVESAQSVALSLMLRWTDRASQHGLSISFTGLSDKLMDLAKVSELEDVLKLR